MLMSSSHSAFVSKRLISDNVLMAYKLNSFLKTKEEMEENIYLTKTRYEQNLYQVE